MSQTETETGTTTVTSAIVPGASESGASELRQGRSPAGRSSPLPGILAVRSTLRTQR
ncbi:hypothetical protein ACFWJM_29615 [Streptomyces sp. NPDC127077]|uniref:hypothetical protein n=1 Tax=Streptomyces sp. NPDC127077 TaxID=3347131 RepID=UPI00364BBDDC